MNNKTKSRPSIVSLYDELMRDRAVLTKGIEEDFHAFVANQEECRKKWYQTEKERDNLESRVKTLESENSALETKLRHAREQIDHEMKKRIKVEHDRDALENQVQLIRELLMNDKNHGRTNLNDEQWALLSTTWQPSHVDNNTPKRKEYESRVAEQPVEQTFDKSTEVLSDSCYDHTGDDLDTSYLNSDKNKQRGRKWKRKQASAPPIEEEEDDNRKSPPKRARTSTETGGEDVKNTSVTAKTTITIPHNGGPMLAVSEITTDTPKHHTTNDNNSNAAYHLKDGPPQTPGCPITRSHSSASKLNRAHAFVQKTVIKPESCTVCGKRLRFGKTAYKCRDCRTSTHPECKEKAPFPCIPATPSSPHNNRRDALTITDFVTNESPMVPALVIHCVNEIELRGLTEAGLYRLSGSDREVKELKERFLRGRGLPNLSAISDINVVTGCLKSFLRTLKEPLITNRLWKDFVAAAECENHQQAMDRMFTAVKNLPQANRDTIAFIILHLQRVSDSPDCKMPISNLAKVFGPTIVGYSTQKPEPLQMINETRRQAAVMETLMNISSDYWSELINDDDEDDEDNNYDRRHQGGVTGTPTVLTSMLGPATNTPGSRPRQQHGFTTASRYNSHKTPRQFFSSPTLK
ncbi:rac GTPase-activating protein 1-like [Tubulanus polymorphus]|uniref:rac GTPase-activating protein 1-like n=1 Tax=Tubulanus polymorphus TaxID=672921 RepID=UPI003DA55C54